MIARILIPLVLLTVLPSLGIAWIWLRRKPFWKLMLHFIPTILLVVDAIMLSRGPAFVPDDFSRVNRFLFLWAIIVIPQMLFCLMAGIGWLCRKVFRWRRTYAGAVAWALTLLCWYVVFYGSFVGFQKLEVVHVEFASADLPESFDGYRIVQFSDAHVGTYTGSRQKILQRAVDSINAQHADMVVFTGDLQNLRPQEVAEHIPVLSSIKARDGVYSVLGNHDYPIYIGDDPFEQSANMGLAIGLHDELHWQLLMNEHRTIRWGDDRIVIAGMENDGEPPFPQEGDVQRALTGLDRSSFVVMLEHDPTAWRRKILPHCHAQLTLSGHTHAMQFSLLGWSPVSLKYRESQGMYRVGDRALYVSKGLGGIVPFRFGATGEIVVITLHHKG